MKEVKEFKKIYEEISKGINEKLGEYNKKILKNKTGYLKENLEYFANLNSNGKLIRGFLISLGYKMSKHNDISYSYPLSLAYEIFQTSVLIHDDIIDEDNLRRGKKTIHYINYENDRKYDEILSKKIGDSVGICMGDYGFFEGNKIMIEAYKDDKNLPKILSYYNDIVLKTIEGELIDVKLSFDGKYKINETDLFENIMLIYKYKTAYYTIIGPLILGLKLGSINDHDKLKDIEEFGEKIGVAFQIQDDILGIYNDMGKVVGSDIKEYKQTLLYSKTMENEKYRDELLKYYGKSDITNEEIEKVRNIFKESGSYDYSYNMMNNLYDDALKDLNNIKWVLDEDKIILQGFVEYLRNRNKQEKIWNYQMEEK